LNERGRRLCLGRLKATYDSALYSVHRFCLKSMLLYDILWLVFLRIIAFLRWVGDGKSGTLTS